jgi:hypothetical protein
MIGERFDRLVVIRKAAKKAKNATFYECRCDCGNLVTARSDKLKSHRTKSCGCIKAESLIIRKLSNVIHHTGDKYTLLCACGEIFTRTMKTLESIQPRCSNCRKES